MKIRRPGHNNISFGCCHSVAAIVHYAKLEGFLFGDAKCRTCKHSWVMMVNPDQLSSANLSRQGYFSYPGQPCLKCGVEAVSVKLHAR